MRTYYTVFVIMILLLAHPAMATPDPSVDPGATVVHLRKNCNEQGAPIQNCFEDAALLWNTTNGWIWFTRNPTPTQDSPLIVDVGPGVFGKFTCNGTTKGNVTVRGSGREVTILEGAGVTGNGAEIQNCVNLSFLDIGLRGGNSGVQWIGVGNASWTNVDIVTTALNGVGYAWYDLCDDAVPGKSLQYLHSSRTRNTATPISYLFPWASTCAETWYFGGEILATISGPGGAFASGAAIVSDGAILETFGTAIRARVTTGGSSGLTLYGVRLLSGAEFHAHGGVISVKVLQPATQAINVVGIGTLGTGNHVHTPGNAFVVQNGSAVRRNASSAPVQRTPSRTSSSGNRGRSRRCLQPRPISSAREMAMTCGSRRIATRLETATRAEARRT